MKAFERIKTMTINEKALELHEKWNGKLDTVSKVQVKTREDLALAYTPGVAEPVSYTHLDPSGISSMPSKQFSRRITSRRIILAYAII